MNHPPSTFNGSSTAALAERERYVKAWNSTMIKIWREQITLLGVIDTGALYRSTIASRTDMDGKILNITMEERFNTYGLFVDFGTGRNTPRGNSGDIGTDNPRRRRRWFSKKYYASVMSLREFLADNVGREYARIISNALPPSTIRKAVSK